MKFGPTKTTLRAALAVLLVLLCLGGAGQASAKAPERDLYWGAWIGDQLTGTQPPWDMAAVADFERMIGKGLSLIQFAAPFADCSHSPCRMFPFPTAEMQSVRNYGAIPFFSWSSQGVGSASSINQPDFQLGDLIAGRYDSYIRHFAADAARWGHPFFLRFNWEMNGTWFPWGGEANGNRPKQYKRAWRHVHDIFTAAGATNASWAWCPYVGLGKRFRKLAQYYPGNRYVDWTCMDGYNWAGAAANPLPWMSFDQIFGPGYRIIAKLAPNKPMILGEIASNGSGRPKARWIRSMFRSVARRYPKVHGLIWFNQPDRGINWTLETSKPTVRAFRSGLETENFLDNSFTDLAESPIPPPR